MSLEAANRSLDFAPNDPAASATPRCSPWRSSNTLPRSSSAFALPTPSPISPTRRCVVVPRSGARLGPVDAHRTDERSLARAGLRGCRALLAHPCTLVPARGRGTLLPNRVSRWRLCPRQRGCGLYRRACPCAVRGDAGTAGGLGAPDNASFAAWVATNDIVRSQIDERILRAAEQGLPFKGGDL